MNFETAFQNIVKIEGGYVNHPLDSGGPTCYGVTIKTLSDFLGHDASEEDVKNLSLDTAKKIYKQNYWDRLKLDSVKNVNLACVLFDQSVNRGTRKVSEQIQKLVGVPTDGVIGPASIAAINAQDPKKLLLSFIKETQNTYTSIVSSNPSQVVFIKGWIARTHQFLDFLL